MTIMSKNAHEYGLDQVQLDSPVEYDTVKIDATTNLALVSDLADAPISQLQQLNPALLRGMIPTGFDLRVPKGTGATLTAALEQVPTDRRPSWRIHRVQSGETLAQIAREYHSSSSAIAVANSLSGNDPSTGDRLLIPAAYHETTPPLRVSRAHKTHHRSGQRTLARSVGAHTAGTRTGSRSHVVQAAAKRPLHGSSTIAQLNHRSHNLNR
jgi:LysM repeat protein